MIRINCPFCGERDHSEFTYGKDASIQYPELDGSTEDWVNAVFERENIDGVVLETWHHNNGCRMWLLVERDTVTHEIFSVKPCHGAWADVLNRTPKEQPTVSKGATSAAPRKKTKKKKKKKESKSSGKQGKSDDG